MQSDSKRRRTFRPQPISRMLDGVLRGHPGARRARGFAGLKRDWADIAGPDFKDIVWPDRLDPPRGKRPGALRVRVVSGVALLLQHDAPRLIQRVNTYLGNDAIGAVKIVPGAPPAPVKRVFRKPPLDADHPTAKALEVRAASVGSERLAAALVRLGRAVGRN
jgi:hypothetical protein